jgi:hypothetical protein
MPLRVTRPNARRTRRLAAFVAVAVAVGLVPTAGEVLLSAAPAGAAGCPTVSPSVPAPTWGPVANGVVSGTASVRVAAGHTTIHLLDVDLTNPNVGVGQLGDAVTDARQVLSAANGVSNAVAAINGDFFHSTDDYQNVAPDGAMGAAGRVMKGWSVSQPTLSVTAGHAAAGWTHLRGQLLFSSSTATANVQTAQSDSAGSKAPASKKATKKKTTKKAAHKKKAAKKKAGKRKVSKKRKKKTGHAGAKKKPSAPKKTTTTGGATASALPALGSSDLSGPISVVNAQGRQTLLPLVAENDDQATGAVLYTSDWGPGDISAGWPLNAREIEMTNGVVTSVHDVGDTGLPAGHTALVVNGSDASALSWVTVGDHVAQSSAMIADATGSAADVLIGGDSLLLQGGTVQDYQCTLDSDTSVRPRQIVGTRLGGTHLMIMTADGDTHGDPGMTVREAAEVVHDLSWTEAMNDDGGASAQQVVKVNGHLTLVSMNSQHTQREVPDGLVITSH